MARQNRLLDSLPAPDLDRLLPELEFVPLPAGWVVHGSGARERYLYFLTSGIVSRFYVIRRSGASAGLALTGNEGVIGVAAFLGGESTLNEAVVLCTGYACRLPSDGLNETVAHVGSLSPVLLRYTQALMSQTAQIGVCYRHHSVEQQLCRWLLSCLDRLPSNDLWMTQAVIAGMLGVRREGVTEAAGRLQREGLIRYTHGHITVLDRPRLEERVCECYAVIKREYERLLASRNCHGSRPGSTPGAVESMRGGWGTYSASSSAEVADRSSAVTTPSFC
jgi:CRP-like cAMP-binding protein